MSLLNLQRGILPNIYTLKKLIPWFDAVSAFIDAQPAFPQIVAQALVDSAGNMSRNFGFNSPVLHPGAGQFAINLTTVSYNVNDLVCLSVATNVGTPGGAINTYPAMSSGSQVFINIWQIAATTAVRTAVDSDFFIAILKRP